MSPPDEAGPTKPTFVNDNGVRRHIAALVGVIALSAAVAGTALIVSALLTRGPERRAAIRSTEPLTEAATEFAVSTEQLAPSHPVGTAPCERVEGTVYADLDGNGARLTESEEGLPDVEVDTVDINGLQRSTITDSEGNYRIELDAPSKVRVQFRGVSNQLIATPVGPDTHPWVDVVQGGPTCRVDSAGLYEGWFSQTGIHGTPVRELGDLVWRDENGNGVQDPNEPGIGGVRLELVDGAGTMLAATTTSPSGNYRFGGLAASEPYGLKVITSPADSTGPLGGLTPTTPRVGTLAGSVTIAGASGWDSDLGSTGDDSVILVPPAELGASDHSFDLGFRPST